MTPAAGPVEELPLVVDPTGQSLRIPEGTTAQRPAAPVPGMIRFNTQTGILEAFQSGVWGNFAEVTSPSIPGSTVLGRPFGAAAGPQVAMIRKEIQRLVYNIGNLYPTLNGVADDGFLLPFGQNLSRAVYADLFAKWGTFFGVGDGSTTFGVPDLRGRALAGADNMGGAAANRLTAAISGISGIMGSFGGLEYHYLSEAQMPQHQHSGTTGTESADHTHTGTHPSYYGMNGGSGRGWSRADSGGQSATLTSNGRNVGHTHSMNTDYKGSSQWHPNVQPTFVLNVQFYTGVHA
jgi:microcystin-dependent protein